MLQNLTVNSPKGTFLILTKESSLIKQTPLTFKLCQASLLSNIEQGSQADFVRFEVLIKIVQIMYCPAESDKKLKVGTPSISGFVLKKTIPQFFSA